MLWLMLCPENMIRRNVRSSDDVVTSSPVTQLSLKNFMREQLLPRCSLPMRVTKHEGPDGVQDGYILDIVRDGRSISQIGVLFDGEVSQTERFRAAADGAATIATAARLWTDGIVPCSQLLDAGLSRHCTVASVPPRCLCPQVTEKHEWVGRGADGFPTLEGKVSEIKGKHLTIRCALTRSGF